MALGGGVVAPQPIVVELSLSLFYIAYSFLFNVIIVAEKGVLQSELSTSRNVIHTKVRVKINKLNATKTPM